MSPDKNVVRMWSGQEHQELSITDLTALIEAGPSRAAVAARLFNPGQEGDGTMKQSAFVTNDSGDCVEKSDDPGAEIGAVSVLSRHEAPGRSSR